MTYPRRLLPWCMLAVLLLGVTILMWRSPGQQEWAVAPTPPSRAILIEDAPAHDHAPNLPAPVIVSDKPASPTAQRIASIHGRVVDREGVGVPGVAVRCCDMPSRGKSGEDFSTAVPAFSSPSFHATTGDAGEFTLGDLPEGQRMLSIEAVGFVPAWIHDVSVGGPPLRVELTRCAIMKGKVVERDSGLGVVVALKAEETSRTEAVGHTLVQHGDGTFTVTELAPGTWTLHVDDPRYVLCEQPVSLVLEAGETITDLRLVVSSGGAISGRLLDADTGAGVAGASIHFYVRASVASPRARERMATTDSEGNFRVTGLPAGSCSVVRGETPGYGGTSDWRDALTVRVALGKETGGVELTVSRGISLRGAVLAPGDVPVAQARVTALALDSRHYQTVQADDEGRFELDGFARDDRVSLSAESQGLATLPMPPIELATSVMDGVVDGVVVSMIPEGVIEGIVVDERGAPVTNARVICRSDAGVIRHEWSNHDAAAEPRFRIAGLPPGVYSLTSVAASGGKRVLAPAPVVAPIHLDEGETATDVKLICGEVQGEFIAGRVTDAAGRPVQGAEVMAHARLDEWGGYRNGSFTDENGAFRVQGLEPGQHDISVSHQAFARARLPRIAAGENSLVIVMPTPSAIDGIVLDSATQSPIARFEVCHAPGTVSERTPLMAASRRCFYDDEGAFCLEHVAPGETTLLVRAPGYEDRFVHGVQVSEGSTAGPLRVELEPAD